MTKKTNPSTLPNELVWGEGGHLSDVALAALGDGQDAIVPENARDHAFACESCTRAMGHAAMLSSELGVAMRARAEMHEAATRVPVPWFAIAIALVIAALGSASALLEAPLGLVHEAPLALHAGTAILRGLAHGVGPTMSLGCAALLFAAGAVVARSMPRTWASEKI